MKNFDNEYVEFRKSGIHGMGGFAKVDIPEGTRVIEYVGEKITKKETDRRVEKVYERFETDEENHGAVYIFTLNKKYDIDGDVPYNPARYINHSCDPNCETDIIKGRIWIISTRDIKQGEEILYNYGFDFDSYEDHPCQCGAKRCIGYILIEDEWPRLKRKLKREAEKKKKAEEKKEKELAKKRKKAEKKAKKEAKKKTQKEKKSSGAKGKKKKKLSEAVVA